MRSATPSASRTSPCPLRRTQCGRRSRRHAEENDMTFAYQQASSVAGAAKAALAADAKILAGGQSLLGAIKLGLAAPEALIDLGALADLKGIRVEPGKIVIGAMTHVLCVDT
eukprot:Opistho-1_new@72434